MADGALARFADAAGERIARDAIRLLPVIPDPGKILCVGHNYEDHRQETGRAKVDNPSIFTRFADTLVAAGQPILRPAVSTSLDYEAELAVIIGAGGRAIAEEDAMRHVAGYACFNDASVRDWQWHTGQFTPGKNFPGTAPFGPELVTPDEIADLASIAVVSRLNGAVMQQATVADMIFSIPRIIAYISTFTPLAPGDVIATGTPGGVGAKRQPPVWMAPGDTIEVEVSGVGLLQNPIAAG
jgi:2-keto-4-pentenoate hydratase/2-oxohepta-3-ene-1,7-dioic acid hydratase in catechol pathway